MDDGLWNEEEAAQYLGLSVFWLRRKRCDGGGPPFFRVGRGSVRYRRDRLDAWLEEREHRSTAEYEEAS